MPPQIPDPTLSPDSPEALPAILAAVEEHFGVTTFQTQNILNFGPGIQKGYAYIWLCDHGFIEGYNDWRNRGDRVYFPADHPIFKGTK